MIGRRVFLGLCFLLTGWMEMLGANGDIRQAYPSFPEVDIMDGEGEIGSTADWSNEGFPIVVVLWAQWSSPSRKLLMDLKGMFDAVYAKSYWQIYAVSVDDSRTVDGVKPLFKELGLPFKLYFDYKESLVNALSPNALPAVFVLGEGQEVVWSHNGYKLDIAREIASAAITTAKEVDPTLGYFTAAETFANNVRGWWVGNDPVGKRYAELRDGNYLMGSDSLGLWSNVAIGELRGKTQFFVEARIRRLKGGENHIYGIAWGDPNSGNYFDLYTSEDYVFVRQSVNGVMKFPKSGSEPCEGPESPAPLRCGVLPYQVNTLGIHRHGSYYTFFMNGWKMAEVEWDYPLPPHMGFVVWQGCHIMVEDVTWGYPAE